jgi:hypothetical protein
VPATHDGFSHWARIEPRPRGHDFDRTLQARVEDPLWMLTRQWQFGEFHGEDAGSAVMTTLAHRSSPITQIRVGASSAPYDHAVPLEARVERLPIDFPPPLRAHIGRYLLTMLTARFGDQRYLADFRRVLLGLYPLDPPSNDSASDQVARARAETSGLGGRVHRALAGRVFDGVAFAVALTMDGLHPDLAALVAPEPKFYDAVAEFRDWFTRLYAQPTDDAPSGWDDARLEYDFGVTVARDKGEELDLVGASTPTGRVDWYSFDLAGVGTTGDGATPWEVTGVIPGPVTFAGMPHPRWWQIEDASVSLGHLRADATDLSKLLVTDFALVYGNDWLSVPLPQPVGTLAEIAGIVVTDVFGRRTLVRAATGAAGDDWSRWDLFSVSNRYPGLKALGQHLFLPPVAPSSGIGPVLEEAAFVRDEAADVVWAVETIVPNGLGGGRDGADAGRRLRTALDPTVPAGPPAPPGTPGVPADQRAGLRYLLGTTVPENWIPFLPVSIGVNTHSMRLVRSWLPRPVPAGSRVRPVTSILRRGMTAADEVTDNYLVNEEEIPRSGVRVRGVMQRTRWTDGTTVVWHGRQRRTGRGEGASGLRFDVLEVDET